MTKLFVFSLVFLFILRLRFPSNKSIAQIVTSRYGNETLKLLRKLEKLDYKQKKLKLDIDFLDNCVKHELVPKFVQFKVANRGLRNSKAYKACQKKLLHQEIVEKKRRLKTIVTSYEQLSARIRNCINIIDFAHITRYFLTNNDNMLTRVRLIQEKKLVNLGLRSANESNDPEKVIFNFSSHKLTQHEKSLLVKGLNLSIPPKQLNYGDFLMPFELMYKQLLSSMQPSHTNNDLDPVAAAIKEAAFDCLHNYDPKIEQNLTTNEYTALKSLLQDNEIIIQKSDKGNSVVLLNKADYLDRMNQLLSDKSKFLKLNIKEGRDYNYIINQEIKISKILRELKNKGAINDNDYQSMNPTGTQPSVLYGLSKVHKALVNNVPKLRPILSAINTPTYKLSQYLNKLLKPFTSNEYTTKDSFSFATDIRKQPTSSYMTSLDIDSLFTNIPLEETIKICSDLLFHDKDSIDGLTKHDFEQLLNIATKESFILFNGTYYKQIDGVAMGSPLAPSLANIFLCYNEKKWLTECPAEFKPNYYKRYVDDIILLFSNADCSVKFKEYMNSQHINMNFTSENEEDDSLAFLDVFVTRKPTGFVTSVYRKPTFSGVYTNFDSFLPSIYKTGLISTLLYRSYTICSNWKLIHTEMITLQSLMSKNGYPTSLVDRIISLFLNKLFKKSSEQSRDHDNDKSKCFQVFLPFLGTSSKRLEKKITSSLRQHLPNIKIKFVYRAATRLRSLFAFKDRIPSYLSSGIVYKFKCGGCNSSYIGESIRHAKTRFSEHMGISALTGKKVGGQRTAVKDHIVQCKCGVSSENFEILCRDNIESLLLIKESLFIHRDRPDLNIQGSSTPLTLFVN